MEAAEKSIEEESDDSSKAKKKAKASEWGKLTKAVITKLEAAGYNSLEDLSGMDLKQLQDIEGIGKVSAEKILGEIS
ncbi:hypothetical protein KKF04_04805 [Patescibacteria group bacterium]|nr:hypothetical protein [Patescibacteria group bacterium]